MLRYKSIHAASQDCGFMSLKWMEGGYAFRVAALLFAKPML